MKAFRSILVALCLALPLLPGAVAAAEPAAKVQGKVAKPAAKTQAKPAASKKAKPVARKNARPSGKAVAKPLPKTKVDLSLPKAMVNQLEPDVGDTPPSVVRKPILPSMFPTKPQSDDSPFQLNGRLISNEMQLQMRNDSRRDVEGAAIDFEFRN